MDVPPKGTLARDAAELDIRVRQLNRALSAEFGRAIESPSLRSAWFLLGIVMLAMLVVLLLVEPAA